MYTTNIARGKTDPGRSFISLHYKGWLGLVHIGHLFPDVKTIFCAYDRKTTIDYNNVCNDNYDSNDGNFDDNDDKKHTHIISFE